MLRGPFKIKEYTKEEKEEFASIQEMWAIIVKPLVDIYNKEKGENKNES